MLSNAYFLAKFCFDTAENEPAKNLQNFRKMQFFDRPVASGGRARRHVPQRSAGPPGPGAGRARPLPEARAAAAAAGEAHVGHLPAPSRTGSFPNLTKKMVT